MAQPPGENEMRGMTAGFLAGLLWLSCGAPARAGYMYVFDQSNYSVTPGGTVDVRVYLQETGSSLLATDGLIAAGVRVTFATPTASQPAQVLSPADIFNNPAFDGPVFPDVQPGQSAGLSEFVDIASPPVTATGGPPFQVLLGTFRFTAGLVQGDVTNLVAGDYDPTTSDTVTGPPSFTTLDGMIADGSATITVTGTLAAPEPCGLGLAAVGAGALAAFRWRGRRRVIG